MFPYLKISTRTLLVDDDETFVDALSNVIPARLHPQFCLHPSEVDRALVNEAELLMREQGLLMALDPSREGPCLARALDFLRSPERREIFTVLVSDHAMPAEMGAMLCGRHRYAGLRRILLTGAADVDVAVEAFNSGSIDHFLPKQTPRLIDKLVAVIGDHHCVSAAERGACLGQFQTAQGRSLLARKEVADGLSKLLEDLSVVEYVTLGSPLGVMGLKSDGEAIWIQLEELESLPLLQSMAGEMGWDQPEVGRIVSDRLLPNLDLAVQFDGVNPVSVKGLELAEGVLAGVFPLQQGSAQ